MKGYGLHMRMKPSQQQKKQTGRPPLPTALGFRVDDDDDVETEILRQASKNKSLRDIEEQQKKALEEDPSVFDYDGVYDQMKEKVARPRAQDLEERKPKYIHHLIKKAEERQKSQDIVYERKLAKERSTEDHLYGDKDKFVTSAYKKKLAEQAKWIEEECLREIREEKDDVTKKDLTDFYLNLQKNVAYGANKAECSKPMENAHLTKAATQQDKVAATVSSRILSPTELNHSSNSTPMTESEIPSISNSFQLLEPNARLENSIPDKLVQDKTSGEQLAADKEKINHHKRTGDTLADAKQRYLARKRAKEEGDPFVVSLP